MVYDWKTGFVTWRDYDCKYKALLENSTLRSIQFWSYMQMPGDQATVRVSIPDKMPLMEGQNFTLRENKMTVGTGRIVSLKVSTYEGCLSVTIMLKHLNIFFFRIQFTFQQSIS